MVKQIWFRHGTINSNDTETWIRTYAPTNTETNTYGWSNWQQIPKYTNKNATNGYAKIGNTLFQWGTFKATVEGTSTITFPTPFSNANYAPFCRRHQAGDNDYENGFASSRTTTSFKAGTWKDYTYSWFAIGY